MIEDEKFILDHLATAEAKADNAMKILLELSVILVEKGIISSVELQEKMKGLLVRNE